LGYLFTPNDSSSHQNIPLKIADKKPVRNEALQFFAIDKKDCLLRHLFGNPKLLNPFGGCMRQLLVLIACGLITSNTFAGELSAGMQNLLSQTDSSASLLVLLSLEDQADIVALDLELHESCNSLAERHFQIVSTLMETANRSQSPVIQALDNMKLKGQLSGYTPHWITNAIVVRTQAEFVPQMALIPGVEIVEPDLVVELIEPIINDNPPERIDRTIGITEGIQAIEADRVWYELGITGEGAIVANMDTGVNYNHNALSDRWRGNFAPPGECWLNYDGSQNPPSDSHGHGSHVMGTITGLAADDTIGVAPGALWIASNAIYNSGGNESFDNGVLAALEWFADPDGDPFTVDEMPDVVQNSWGINENFPGYSDCDSRWWEAIDNCEAAGVALIWSAGNEGSNSTTIRSPADRNGTALNCFSIGSTRTYSPYHISDFSSRGPSGCMLGFFPTKPEVSAPGEDIYSVNTWGGYTWMSGTSMAGPHVAGVVGLMRSANQNLDVTTIKEILIETSLDLGIPGEDNVYGWGMINAYDAVLESIALIAPDAIDDLTISHQGAEVQLSWTELDNVDYYRIERSILPHGPWVEVSQSYEASWSENFAAGKRFYRVVAVKLNQ
jgi:subtilisin family serine protease